MEKIELLSVEDLVDEAAYYGASSEDRTFCDYDPFEITQEINRRIRQAKIDVLEDRFVVESNEDGIKVCDTRHPNYQPSDLVHVFLPWFVASWPAEYYCDGAAIPIPVYYIESAHRLCDTLNGKREY